MKTNKPLQRNLVSETLQRHSYSIYPDLSCVKKILVTIFKNIGDTVLASPVFTILRNSFPDASIDALVNSGTEEVLMDNPYINHLHFLNRQALKSGPFFQVKEELKLLRLVRSSKYDMVITLKAGSRGQNIAYLSGAEIRVGVESKKKISFWENRFFTSQVRRPTSNRHNIEKNIDYLRRIGIFPDKKLISPTFYEGETASFRIKKLLTKAGIADNDLYIAIHPTSKWMFKCWPYEKVAKLIDSIQSKIQIPVILTSGPDTSEISYIKNVLSCVKCDIADFSGILSLRELGALIRGAKLFLGVDSAPMHIATAVKTPVVALFGPTNELEWGPWGKGHRVITSNSYSCRPCNHDGCGGSKVSECLTNLPVSTVFTAVKKKLQK